MGIHSEHHISTIIDNGQVLSTLQDISNSIGKSFAFISSSNNYHSSFIPYKNQAERQRLNFSSRNSLPYNRPFTECKLNFHLKNTGNTSPGPDRITYDMLKHHPHHSVLNLFVSL